MDDHTHIGHTSHGKPVALTRDERLRHMAIFGSTGVGKTTFLLNIVAQDIARGDGLLVIDPHGDFAEKALSLVPPSRNNQVCYFNLTDSAYPIGFNVLEDVAPDHRAVVADGVVAGMRAIWTTCGAPARTDPSPFMRGAPRDAERVSRLAAAASHRYGLSRPHHRSHHQSPDAGLFRTPIQ